MEKKLLNTFNKELLLKDICARLPYGVILHNILRDYDARLIEVDFIENKIGVTSVEEGGFSHHTGLPVGFRKGAKYVQQWLPYLFPLSSMTEEQKKEFIEYACYEERDEDCGRHKETYYYDMVGHENALYPNCDAIDWLNAHHFDYRGLIPKGLAIDATGLNVY